MASIGTRVDDKSALNERVITLPPNNILFPPYVFGGTNNQFPNTLRIPFPVAQKFARAEITLHSLNIPYSWFNISAQQGNNVFQFAMPTGSTYNTFNVTIPDGFYEIDDLNTFFQLFLLTNQCYTWLTSDTTQTPIFYIDWVSNPTYYRTTIFASPVPAAGGLYSYPANYAGTGVPPTSSVCPSIIIGPVGANSNSNAYPAGSVTPGAYSFSKTLGFSPGAYPPANTTTAYNANGQFPPMIETTNIINVEINCVSNSSISPNPRVIAQLSPNTGFGSLITYQPFQPLWLPITDGQYESLTIRFLDEFMTPINNQDGNITGALKVRGG